MIDAAEEQYTEFHVQNVAQEWRRIWKANRYVYVMADVADLGRPATVEPSTLPIVKEIAYGRKEHKPCTIDLILDWLEENGPARLTDLHHGLGISHSTLIWSLQNYNSVVQDENKLWHLNTEPTEPAPALDHGRAKTKHVDAYLREHGPSIVAEIVEGTGLAKSTVQAALYRNRAGYAFEQVGKRIVTTGNNGSRQTAVWDVVQGGD